MSQSVTELRKGLNRYPLDPNVILAVANALAEEQHVGAAYHLLRRAASLSKDLRILINYGRVLMMLAATAGDENWMKTAQEVFTDAVTKFPDSPDAVGAMGVLALQQGKWDEAEAYTRDALDMNPNLQGSVNAMAMIHFYRNRWGEGFDWFERSIIKPMRFIPVDPPAPYWDGTPGRNLVVFGEQGIGDELSYYSMIPDAAKENNVTLRCTSRLANLLARSLPGVNVEGVHSTKQDNSNLITFNPAFDAKCLAASLGRHYRRDGFGERKGYLVADPVKRAFYRARLDMLPGRKIGIAWTGGMAPSFWHRRGLPPEDLVRMLDMPGVSWVSLQYTKGDPIPNVLELPEAIERGVDYDETAALVMELDEVVTVTTAMAHLCGALGKRAHVIVNEIPRYFYGIEGSEHAWYSSLVLHRQRDGAWPIDEVKEALA